MNVEDYIASGVLEQYVLGELSTAEEGEVLSHAKRYPEVRREIIMIEESLEHMARSLSIKPPAHLLDQIQHKIAIEEKTEDGQAKKNKKISILRYGVAATFTLKLMFMAVAAHFWISWQQSESRLELIRERYDLLEQQTQKLSQAFVIVNNPDVQTIVLESSGTSGDKDRLIMYWNEVTGEVYINPEALPTNDENHQYQLWAIKEDKPLSLGVFDAPSTAFPQMIQLENVENISSFMLTLESEGGNSSPNVKDQHYVSKPNK